MLPNDGPWCVGCVNRREHDIGEEGIMYQPKAPGNVASEPRGLGRVPTVPPPLLFYRETASRNAMDRNHAPLLCPLSGSSALVDAWWWHQKGGVIDGLLGQTVLRA